VLALLSLLRGSKEADSIVGVESCSAVSFVLLFLLYAFMLAMTAMNIIIVKREYAIKIKYGYEFAEGDLRWDSKLLTQFVIAAVGAGFIAGVFGLGGGVIFNPLLLSFGVPATVAASTGMFMIMFSSLSNSFLFSMAGLLNYEYGLWCAGFVVVGTILGIKMINDLIKKTGRSSYLTLLLAFVVGISAVVVPIFGIIQIIQKVNDGDSVIEFEPF